MLLMLELGMSCLMTLPTLKNSHVDSFVDHSNLMAQRFIGPVKQMFSTFLSLFVSETIMRDSTDLS